MSTEISSQSPSNQNSKIPNAPLIVWAKRRHSWWPAVVIQDRSAVPQAFIQDCNADAPILVRFIGLGDRYAGVNESDIEEFTEETIEKHRYDKIRAKNSLDERTKAIEEAKSILEGRVNVLDPEEWRVEAILDKKIENNKEFFLVKFEGYSDIYNEWLTRDDLIGFTDEEIEQSLLKSAANKKPKRQQRKGNLRNSNATNSTRKRRNSSTQNTEGNRQRKRSKKQIAEENTSESGGLLILITPNNNNNNNNNNCNYNYNYMYHYAYSNTTSIQNTESGSNYNCIVFDDQLQQHPVPISLPFPGQLEQGDHPKEATPVSVQHNEPNSSSVDNTIPTISEGLDIENESDILYEVMRGMFDVDGHHILIADSTDAPNNTQPNGPYLSPKNNDKIDDKIASDNTDNNNHDNNRNTEDLLTTTTIHSLKNENDSVGQMTTSSVLSHSSIESKCSVSEKSIVVDVQEPAPVLKADLEVSTNQSVSSTALPSLSPTSGDLSAHITTASTIDVGANTPNNNESMQPTATPKPEIQISERD
jgi:hypothetical protein